MLRVLHVFGRLERGGAELRTVELAESFGGERVRSDFLVLSGLDGALDDRVRAAGGEVIKCPLGAQFPTRFYRLLRRRRYDIVHSHVHYFSGVVLAIARMARTPGRVAHFRSAIGNDGRNTLRRRVQLAACRRLVHFGATDILAVGEGAMQVAWSPRWQSDPRCRIVYNGLPTARIRRIERRAGGVPTIINVASLRPLKNQVRLVRILHKCVGHIPGVRLLLIGREVGAYGREVRRVAAEAGLSDRVDLIGEVDEPMAWIAGSDLLLLPSLWEGLPGAALEACAVGVPVLASDLPGTRELAAHFPHMTLLPLASPDEDWAAAAVRLLQKAPEPGSQSAEQFAKSPFTLARTRETHYEIWSRSRASA